MALSSSGDLAQSVDLGSLIKKAVDNVSLCWSCVCGEKILARSCFNSLETKAPGKQEQTALIIVHSHRTQWVEKNILAF